MRSLILALQLLLIIHLGTAQSSTKSPSRILTKETTVLNECRQFSITVQNVSEKTIAGYIIKCTRIDSAESKFDSFGLGGLSYDLFTERKKPGDKWNLLVSATTTNVPQETAADVNLDVDFVLFADRTAAGPDTMGYGMMMRGEMEGVMNERARLKSILQKEGVSELETTLEAPEWERGRAN